MAEWTCPKCFWKNAGKWDRCAKCGYPQNPTPRDIEQFAKLHEKQENFLFTTTPTIEGHPITKYHGAITSNVVLGTGLISDLNAVVADFGGGRSTGYQKKIDEATSILFQEMYLKAIGKSASVNAIVSLSIDYTTVAESNMMMVCGAGTAVEYSVSSGNTPSNE